MKPGTYPESGGESILDVGANTEQKRFSAGDESHACREMPDHVVGRQVHPVDVRVQGKVLAEMRGRRERR